MKSLEKYKHPIRRYVPEIVREWLGDIFSTNSQLKGMYPNWQAALSQSSGYCQQNILEATKSASLAVKQGRAKYERDSVLFYDDYKPFPLITCLLAASHKKKHITILDFGGALGSSYYQCHDMLQHLVHIHWIVVEQSHYVDYGNRFFKDKQLIFTDNIQTALDHHPEVALLSSTLQYLEKPYEILQTLIKSDICHLILDRTPFSLLDKELITIQKVPYTIYRASYPCWIFSRTRLLQHLTQSFNLKFEFDAIDRPLGKKNLTAAYKGMYFTR